jgi:hypothetical protein
MTVLENTGKKKGKGFKMEAWWEERTLGEKILLGVGFALMGLGFFALAGWIVMLLWNWLMPEIFSLKQVTYWQAWGLLLLSSILFKGFGSKSHTEPSESKRKKKLRAYIKESEQTGEVTPEHTPED